jgi:hypothetical protein
MTRSRRNSLNHGHRRILDDDFQPLKPSNGFDTKRKRKYAAKDSDRFLDWYHFEMHRRLHPNKPVPLESSIPEPSAPYEHKGRNFKRRKYKRAKRLEQS